MEVGGLNLQTPSPHSNKTFLAKSSAWYTAQLSHIDTTLPPSSPPSSSGPNTRCTTSPSLGTPVIPRASAVVALVSVTTKMKVATPYPVIASGQTIQFASRRNGAVKTSTSA